jgi:hypothetical protein
MGLSMNKRSSWPMVMVLLFAAVMAALLGYYRWTLFLPSDGLIVARAAIAAAVMVAIIAAAAIRMRHSKDPSRSFSKLSLPIILGAGLFALSAGGMTTGAAAYLNGLDARQRTVCLELVGVGNTTAVVSEPTVGEAWVVSNVRIGPNRTLDFRSYPVDFSGLKPGEFFELAVLDGRFGYTVVRGQTAVAGCASGIPSPH